MIKNEDNNNSGYKKGGRDLTTLLASDSLCNQSISKSGGISVVATTISPKDKRYLILLFFKSNSKVIQPETLSPVCFKVALTSAANKFFV